MNYLKKLAKYWKKCKCYCTEDLNIIYDSQDNIVKINGGIWEQSFDLDTWEGVNDKISVRHLWNSNQIQISSNEYVNILAINVNGNDYQVTNINGDWYCTYPEMHEFMNGSDIFTLKVKAIKHCTRNTKPNQPKNQITNQPLH